eukprot:TRINITY_DN75586_c0_g1_i1.p1 TRINITY_DN75586_c0_g1~~TRINITY_DN75586_c0_g1_i1.p1  ORF type:complete len:207 (-),score=84.24 TRINITY_DN75586_c0_g1_i1:99-695(-)
MPTSTTAAMLLGLIAVIALTPSSSASSSPPSSPSSSPHLSPAQAIFNDNNENNSNEKHHRFRGLPSVISDAVRQLVHAPTQPGFSARFVGGRHGHCGDRAEVEVSRTIVGKCGDAEKHECEKKLRDGVADVVKTHLCPEACPVPKVFKDVKGPSASCRSGKRGECSLVVQATCVWEEFKEGESHEKVEWHDADDEAKV